MPEKTPAPKPARLVTRRMKEAIPPPKRRVRTPKRWYWRKKRPEQGNRRDTRKRAHVWERNPPGIQLQDMKIIRWYKDVGVAWRSYPPSVSTTSLRLFMMQVKIGISRLVYRLPSVSRRSMTKSKKSDGESVSKATTNSWSSSPNE